MGAESYYAKTLSGARLQRCYEVAPRRVRHALEAEIEFVRTLVPPDSGILELGCGYGRVLQPLADRARLVVGVDVSLSSLGMARTYLRDESNCRMVAMNASALAFPANQFDVVVCIQNGLSAFQLDPVLVAKEACRVARPGGRAVFSSYSDRFWPERLEWFQVQAEHGLIGEIDEEETADGVIVCRDGFRATTLRVEDFRSLATDLAVASQITEVDGSTIFCVIQVGGESESHPAP